MRHATCIIAITGALLAQAQTNSLTLFGGPSRTRLQGNGAIFREKVNPVAGHAYGLGYTRWHASGLGIQGRLMISRRGGGKDIVYMDEYGAETGRDEARYLFDHVGVALGAAFRTPGRFHAEVSAGALSEWLYKGVVNAPAAPLAGRVITDLTDRPNRMGLSGYGGMGFHWELHSLLSIGTQAMYVHGFSTLSNSGFFQGEDIRERSWTLLFSIAYRWPIAHERP